MSQNVNNGSLRKKRITSYPMGRLSATDFGRSSVPSKSVNNIEKLNTRLIESIPDGHITYMKRLLSMGANTNATCRLNHVSVCHIAALHDNGALALLLKSGADRFRSDQHGRTPLHLAAWAGNANQIILLLNLEDWKSSFAYTLIIPETFEEVRRHCVPLNEFINKEVQPNEVSKLLDGQGDGADHTHWNVMDVLPEFLKGWTALHAASARAQHHCVQLLLAAGADPTAQDVFSRTPLDVAGCAHYMGHKIDVDKFMETVDLLLKAGGQFTYNANGKHLDTPLHTAVELESEAAVKQLLQAGASATVWNSRGLTAMHVCVEKRNKELLQLLTRQKKKNQPIATVDSKDRSGSTVLCSSVKAEWTEGVFIALNAGATNMEVNAQSPIHYIAAQLESIGILNEANPLTNERSLDMHKQYLKVANKILKKETYVINLAAALGAKDVIENLLNYAHVRILINTYDCFGSPLYYALIYNRIDCARLLISKGAVAGRLGGFNINCNDNIRTWTSLLHIAAIMNHYEIAEMIIQLDKKTVHADVVGQLPLDEACWYGHKEMIALLLRNDADLSGGDNERTYYFSKQRELVPIENLMNNVSKPTEFLEDIFDSYISSKGQKFDDCEVEIDFRVLIPKSEKKQMRVIQALLDTGNRYDQQRLLLHPLVESFLYLKWKSVSLFFYIILALHVCFVLFLNVFALSLFWCKNTKTEHLPYIFFLVCFCIIYVAGALLAIQDILIIIKLNKSKRYILCLESLVKCLSTVFAFILPFFSTWDSKPDVEFVRFSWSVTLLLACVRLMFLFSRVPNYGYYVLMYGKVATKVFKILLSFFLVIFGFAVSYMIQFHAEPPFENIGTSILTTMVMMASEIGYIDTMNEKSVEHASASLIMIRLTFLTFLILVTIVLMNLLVGVAVNDVNNLEVIGNIKSLVKQVEFIIAFEEISWMNSFNRWFKPKKWENRIILRPRQVLLTNGYRLPTRLIEAIFEKARLQRRESDKEQHTMLYDMKLDEMHNVIVNKDDAETYKPEDLYNVLNKLFEDNFNKIRGDIEMMKNLITKNNVATKDSSQDEFEF